MLKFTKVDYAVAIAALRRACECGDRNPPTDWRSKARIPHHTDCPMFAIELPDASAAPAAHAAAVELRSELLKELAQG